MVRGQIIDLTMQLEDPNPSSQNLDVCLGFFLGRA